MEQGAQTIYRTIAVMMAIADRNRDGAGMTELSEATRLTPPTVHRILRALTDLGLLVQLKNRCYVLGPLVYDLGLTAAPRFELENLMRDITDGLAEKTGDTVFFARLSGGDMVCVSRTSGSFPVKTLITDVGLRRPLGAGASGLAVLSTLPEEEALKLIQSNEEAYSAQGRTSAKVREEVAAARRMGHVERDIPALGARTISTALRDSSGRPFGSISISSISQRMEGAHLAFCLEALLEAATKAERRINLQYPARAKSGPERELFVQTC